MKKLLLIFLLPFFTCHLLDAQNIIDRFEPANWWTEMKHNEIQLLVYGDNISSYNPVIDSDIVSLEKAVRVENPNYLFLYVTISEDAEPSEVTFSFYDDDKIAEEYAFELRQREPGRADIDGFNSSDVMYLITPDRFANGNTENDEIPGMKENLNRSFKGGRHGGDIKGISDNLDYISEMGFTAIWLNPVLENDMPEYSYHGYAATDFYQVDRRFGSNEEYKKLVQDAGKKGIKVIMDMIVNHSGSEHWFVKDPPASNWLNFQGEFRQSNHRHNTVQDLYVSNYDKKHFSDGWFVETMPDLNQQNELMADYLIMNTLWWIEYSGISGIRMDTYPYPDKDFMSKWTCAVMSEYPEFNIVGEEWNNNPAIVSYWQAGKKNHDGYTSCLPSLMDFPLQDALAKGLTEGEQTYGSGLIKTYEMLTMDFLYADPGKLVIFPDNHDMDRFFTQVNNDFDLFKMGMAYTATMRGTPQIYYGTEILMHNDDDPGDHGIIRTDFPGGWPGDEVNGFTGEGLSDRQKEAQAYIQRLLNWRKEKEVIHSGKVIHFAPENGIYVYFRYDDLEKVMVILNKNEVQTDLKLDRFAEMLDNHSTAKDIMTGRSYDLEGSITLDNRGAYILEIK
ncbi:MAG TPA: glycoside hydrolase family 13 protein [Balneolaceae bacterium]|nr:glycoside hydrolase family 13 protein [Balneolaceae bacterium]